MKMFFLSVALLAVMGTLEAAENVYKNGFSDPQECRRCWKSKEAKITDVYDPGVGKNESGSFKLIFENGVPKQSACFSQFFPVKRGKTYTVIVWAKADKMDDDGWVWLSLQPRDTNGRTMYDRKGLQGNAAIIKFAPADCRDAWKRLTLTFTVPDNEIWREVSQLAVVFGGASSSVGTLNFDDLEVFEITAE